MRNVYCLLILYSWLVAMQPAVTLPLEIGAPLPKADVVLQDFSGKEITLNKARLSNGLLVIFSGNTCPYIERNQARTQEICKYALSNNIGVVLINSNTAGADEKTVLAAMKTYATGQQYNWYYVADKKTELADAFEANHMPECYLFNQQAKLVYKGAIDDNPGNAEAVKMRHLSNAINDLLAGKAVRVNSTQALGCNIKRF
ncbi:redoxin domain-containing protein [Chitinophaga sp. CF418]|uniref:redoxin domain-containing protein n=1 Tax=Chitinophaga sp. CF418 TaxID=1855287 RepID=UPI0009235159|nr:redoxin domain-containing protein [Chitinophaga sp. CF418]SHN45274.1 AhpC/TSA family protein [Chitinophaga sp. CF418]